MYIEDQDHFYDLFAVWCAENGYTDDDWPDREQTFVEILELRDEDCVRLGLM